MRTIEEIENDLGSAIGQVMLDSKGPTGPIERLILDVPELLARIDELTRLADAQSFIKTGRHLL